MLGPEKHNRFTFSRTRVSIGAVYIARVCIGLLLLWSSIPKLRTPPEFLADVYQYELVGPKAGLLVAMLLPWLELLVSVCLIGGIFVGGALLVSLILSVCFTFVQASALYRDLSISCGCFGGFAEDSGMVSYATLVRASAMLAVSGIGFVCWVQSGSDPHDDMACSVTP